MTYIYLIEIENNQVYIGKTKNPTKRVSDHRKTYGGHITYTIIDEVNSLDRNLWKPIETMWIQSFISWGFDVVNPRKEGGGGSSEWSEESKKKQSNILKNRPNTWTTKEIGNKISHGLKNYYNNPKNREKLSKPRKNKWVREKLLSENQVMEIRNKYTQGQRICDLSREYNVSWGTVKNVVERFGGYK